MMNHKIQKLRSFLCIILVSIFTISCTSTRVFTYNVTPLTPSGHVDQTNLTVEKEGFSISYDAKGGCKVTNMRDSTLYLDLGESYVVSDGVANRVFSNSVTTSISSESHGTGVNLGAVAGALGVGGRVGTLASGINVGNGSTSGTSVQSFEERYVSVPPYSTVNVKFTNTSVMLPDKYIKMIPKKGYHTYDKGQLFTVDHILSYSFSPNEPFKHTRNSLYIRSVQAGGQGVARNQFTECFDSVGLKIFGVTSGVVGLGVFLTLLITCGI